MVLLKVLSCRMLNLKVDNYLFIVFEETRVKNLIQNYQKKIFLFDIFNLLGGRAKCNMRGENTVCASVGKYFFNQKSKLIFFQKYKCIYKLELKNLVMWTTLFIFTDSSLLTVVVRL
jgi:dolichyl-phosphate-mannose--protein O-mannosyl transferase